jgi:hypothetical protein
VTRTAGTGRVDPYQRRTRETIGADPVPPFLNRYATPLTLGLFAVSTVSGVALFLHMGQAYFRGMHEWLSMLLLVPFALHVWKNWTPMVNYVRRRTLWWPVALSLAAGLAFAVPAMTATNTGGGSPLRAIQTMTRASLSDLAPVLRTNPDALVADLRARGHKVGSAGDTLETVATASGVPAVQILMQVLPPGGGARS